MKWILGSIVVLGILVVAVFVWWGRDPSTRLVDASGNQLTAGNEPASNGPASNGPATDGAEEVDPLFGPVRAQIEAKEYAAAKETLVRILEDSDRDGEACILLCDVTRELQQVDETVDYGLKAVELLPDSAPAHLAYARAIGLQLQKDSRSLTGMLGAIKGVRRFKAEAERVIELDPTDTFARMMLVFTNLAPAPIGNIERALELAAEIVPHDEVLGTRLLVICHHRNDETDRAIELCREAIAKSPGEGAYHVALADIFVDLERFEEADAEYEAARRGEKDVEYYRSLYYQARWRIENDTDCERALALLEEYIMGEPDYEDLPRVPSALWRKGRALQLLGRVDEARVAWQESVELDPENERSLDSLAETSE